MRERHDSRQLELHLPLFVSTAPAAVEWKQGIGITALATILAHQSLHLSKAKAGCAQRTQYSGKLSASF